MDRAQLAAVARLFVVAGAFAGVALLAGVPTAPALAQDPAKTDDAKKKLESKRNELQDVQKRTQALEGDVQGLAAERERLNSRLVETADLIKKSEAQLTTIETRLGELEEQQRILKGSLNQRNDQIAKLLSALQRMGRNPPPVLITQREDALEMVRSAMLLSAAFPELGTQAKALTARLTELVRVMTEIRSQGEQLRTEMTRLNDARTRLGGLMEEKKVTLEERQSELKRMRVAAADISRNVSDLNELISRLDQAVKDNTGLGAYDEQQKRAAPSPNITPNSSPLIPPNSLPPCRRFRKRHPKNRLPLGRLLRPKGPTSSSFPPARLSAAPGALSLRSLLPTQAAVCPCPRKGGRYWASVRKRNSGANRRELCSKPGKAPKSRHLVMAGLFTLASFAAMANS